MNLSHDRKLQRTLYVTVLPRSRVKDIIMESFVSLTYKNSRGVHWSTLTSELNCHGIKLSSFSQTKMLWDSGRHTQQCMWLNSIQHAVRAINIINIKDAGISRTILMLQQKSKHLTNNLYLFLYDIVAIFTIVCTMHTFVNFFRLQVRGQVCFIRVSSCISAYTLKLRKLLNTWKCWKPCKFI